MIEVQAETDREFWRGVLVAGGFTAIPRWSRDPVAGIAVQEAKIPDDLATRLLKALALVKRTINRWTP